MESKEGEEDEIGDDELLTTCLEDKVVNVNDTLDEDMVDANEVASMAEIEPADPTPVHFANIGVETDITTKVAPVPDESVPPLENLGEAYGGNTNVGDQEVGNLPSFEHSRGGGEWGLPSKLECVHSLEGTSWQAHYLVFCDLLGLTGENFIAAKSSTQAVTIRISQLQEFFGEKFEKEVKKKDKKGKGKVVQEEDSSAKKGKGKKTTVNPKEKSLPGEGVCYIVDPGICARCYSMVEDGLEKKLKNPMEKHSTLESELGATKDELNALDELKAKIGKLKQFINEREELAESTKAVDPTIEDAVDILGTL
ncbi:hypothetical protein GIB67_023015, partial [Kingdonia uniflora]